MSTLFDKIGGYDTIRKVHKIFYDKIYAHPWIGQFFKEVSQELNENQQTDFMVQAFGGPQMYSGAFPVPAHKHMYITVELFELRSGLLKESLQEAGLNEENIESWLRIDSAFKKSLVKGKLEDCERRFPTDEIVHFENPHAKKAS